MGRGALSSVQSNGSVQLRRYRDARNAGLDTAAAEALAELVPGEGALIDAEDELSEAVGGSVVANDTAELAYLDFLMAKAPLAQSSGLPCDLDEIPTHLSDGRPMKEHVRHIVQWMVRGGRRAVFASFGLHKTMMQLLAVKLIADKTGGDGLIVLPLGVRREFVRDAALLGIEVTFIRSTAEYAADGRPAAGVYLTNYETIREGKLDLSPFTVASLDEADVLRSFGSKTFQTFLPLFERVPYRFVATATPDPNRYKELIHYAGFLGVMDTGQALTRFFQRNSEQAGDLQLYEHKVEEFWLWVSSWAVCIQRPSDLGFSDEGYILPPLDVRWHVVATEIGDAGEDDRGQRKLIRDTALGVVQAAHEKRRTLDTRIAKAKELVDADPENHFILWHDLEDERRAIESALPRRIAGDWEEYRDGHPDALALYDRHYSSRPVEERKLAVGPGEKMVLLTRARDALFIWRKFKDDSGQIGVNCAAFRNESARLASDLIRQACEIAWSRWPEERLYTYVDPEEVAGDPAGNCFRHAGWRELPDRTKGGLIVLEARPEWTRCRRPDLTLQDALGSVWGSQDYAVREEIVDDFAEGRRRYLAAKPVMLGGGVNLQRHCHRAIFVGIGFKFRDFIQAIHRLQRFGQTQPVRVDIIHADTEVEVVRDLLAKWARHEERQLRMSEIIRQHGLNHELAAASLSRSIGVERQVVEGEGWRLALNDCVAEAKLLEENSLDLIVTSVPFSNHYEYTPSYNDFGHTDDDDHFFRQMDFLTPELIRALAPGRLACIHVKDRILFGNVTGEGVPTVNPFHAKCIFHYLQHGFQFMGMIHVNTDVVRENNQTYRLSYSEMLKDGTKMGVGSPEYVLLMRKPQSDRSRGYADRPVEHAADDYSLARWQIDAHAFWRSSGDRPLMPDELSAHAGRFARSPVGPLVKQFMVESRGLIYDFAAHVAIGETIEARDPNDDRGRLPRTYMSLQPGATDPNTWDDVVRMRTLNAEQVQKGREKHVCPLQFDIVDRLIERFSNKGELVYDPFCGLGTVPLRALHLGRRGAGSELNETYWRHSVLYLQAAERELSVPSLFDLFEAA